MSDEKPEIEDEPQVKRVLDDFFAADPGALPAEDVVHAMLPLMRQVARLHHQGKVAQLGLHDVEVSDDGQFSLRETEGVELVDNLRVIQRIQPHGSSALKVVGEYRVTAEEGFGKRVDDLHVSRGDGAAITKPLYLTDLKSWESELGHHDEITDVYVVGMILAALACGFDPRDAGEVEQFSLHRTNLFVIQSRLHPVLASIIVEMTALNRHDRATDIDSLATRLETYRDQPVDLDVERLLAGVKETKSRRKAVLSHLRDRLFDLSRRNRLVYFRSTQASVNMTEASVPIVMRIESVRPEQLCTWRGQFAGELLSGKMVPLTKWLRFEDQPHLPSSFDKIISDTRRDRAEYGFNQLRLVAAFLRWHNLKEAPNERIVSPLLWLPVELSKAKGVRDQYMMRCPEPIAEFNPALRHILRQLYDIHLPETVDLTTISIANIHADLLRQIRKSEPGVRLELQDRPQIRLILQKAVQRVASFNRRRGGGKQTVSARADFSYAREDYRPLGHALFEKFVQPSPLPQRLAAGGSFSPPTNYMSPQTEAPTFVTGIDEGHRFSWEIDLTQVTLANLNYRKMSLVRDFNELIERSDALPGFDGIFSIEPRPFTQEAPPVISQADKWNVLPADATQDAAIALARTGRSFIIQGPPGTGKSQTITNLISDYAARGKRVLFVCEKRAALDVVFHRLGQAGLDGLACIIHDSQEDKKEFIFDLKKRYEEWGKSEDRLDAWRAARGRTVQALDAQVSAIAAYDTAVGKLKGDGAQNMRDLVRRAAALQSPPDYGIQQRETLPSLAVWDANRALAQLTMRALNESSGGTSLAAHPFSRLNATTVSSLTPYADVEVMINSAEGQLSRLDRWLYSGGQVTSATPVVEATEIVDMAERLTATGLSRSLDLLDASSPTSQVLQRELTDFKALNSAWQLAAKNAANWSQDALSPEDTKAALTMARAKEGSFFRFLSGDWRRLRATVAQRYNFGAHAVAPTVTSVLELLDKRYGAAAALEAAFASLQQQLQTPDLTAFLDLRDALQADPSPPVARLLDAARASGNPHAALADAAIQALTLRRLTETVAASLDLGNLTFDHLGEFLRDLRESLDDLPDVLPFLVNVHRADKRFANTFRTVAEPLPQLEALVVDEAIACVERANPEIKRFDIDRLIGLARKADSARERLREENSETVCAVLHRNFRNHVRTSELSVTMLDTSGREFKKRYAGGRRELEHEFNKTMRFRSIREMSGGDSGSVVNDLKPIWLMSPLSVSDTLPLQSDLFDVVIFDEASQIPVEEAVPALCRSGQVIIVGDEMQLPPTSFFSAAQDDEDMQVTAEEDGQKIAILLDADSLLAQAARNLPATLLAWHYRSRFESLISFSNAAFYNGQLVTIPDRWLRAEHAPLGPITSVDEDAVRAGAARLTSAPITTHRIADGIYAGRINAAEARYIACLVRELLAGNSSMSLGVVAFSEAQQSEIEDALERLASEDQTFATALEQEYTREDDGQFNGLFVKNLENVQGDERDVILMSVCYAPAADGKMAMNFGPINQRGGEKRLNVIFSRARRHMAIVTTIAPEQITNVHNDGARALRSFLAFAEAQSNGAFDHAQTVLTTLNPEAAQTFGLKAPSDSVREAIAQTLRARGHEVHEYVGGASFRCDLAIVDASGEGYALAILLDRNVEGEDVEERFVFRPGILRSFGWRVVDVPVAAWLRNREQSIARIEAELRRSSWDLADPNPYPDGPAVTPAEPKSAARMTPRSLSVPAPEQGAPAAAISSANAQTSEPPAAPDAMPAAPQPVQMTEFQLVEGTSSKFWRVGVDGKDLIVEFGRIGTKGQRMVKAFDTEQRAKAEATKLMLEKTGKGYSQVS